MARETTKTYQEDIVTTPVRIFVATCISIVVGSDRYEDLRHPKQILEMKRSVTVQTCSIPTVVY
jgi:hypothetical protein